jgi:hypothetical protein
MLRTNGQWSQLPSTLGRVELEVIDACANKPLATSKEGSPGTVHSDPPKNVAEAGYVDHRARPRTSGSLWAMLLWMSGECGLHLHISLKCEQ